MSTPVFKEMLSLSSESSPPCFLSVKGQILLFLLRSSRFLLNVTRKKFSKGTHSDLKISFQILELLHPSLLLLLPLVYLSAHTCALQRPEEDLIFFVL